MDVLITAYIIVVHSTALSISDNLPSYPPDNHHSSDGVYRRGGVGNLTRLLQWDISQAGHCHYQHPSNSITQSTENLPISQTFFLMTVETLIA